MYTCTIGIPRKPDVNFLHITADCQTDTINMFYVKYIESMVFMHVVIVLLLVWVACGIVGTIYAKQIKKQEEISPLP